MAQQRTASARQKAVYETRAKAPGPLKDEGEHERATHAVPDRHVRHRGGTGPDHDDRLVRRVAVDLARPGLSEGPLRRGTGRGRGGSRAQERHPDRRGLRHQVRRAAQRARRRDRDSGSGAASTSSTREPSALEPIADRRRDGRHEPGNRPRTFSRRAGRPPTPRSSRAKSPPTRPRPSPPRPRRSRGRRHAQGRSTRPPPASSKISKSAEKLDDFLASVADAGQERLQGRPGDRTGHQDQRGRLPAGHGQSFARSPRSSTTPSIENQAAFKTGIERFSSAAARLDAGSPRSTRSSRT